MTELRGIQDDVTISLEGRDWSERLSNFSSQFAGSGLTDKRSETHVWLDATGCPPSAAELERLVWMLEMHNIKLDGWSETGETAGQKITPQELPEPPRAVIPEPDGPQASEQLSEEAAFISRTLRSGQVVRFAGTVVVLGDLNPGAVIVAEGNVIVWGKLRGMVHAGAAGDEKAVVGALHLAPAQLRIAGHIARALHGNRALGFGAELALVRDGRIVIENWDDGAP